MSSGDPTENTSTGTAKRRRNADFWRACSFLWPHRRIVAISVVCAFVVGLAFTSGLGTMLPIMSVLIKGDSVQGWMYRQAVEHRLGVTLAEDPEKVEVLRVKAGGQAEAAGLKKGEEIDAEGKGATAALWRLADPNATDVTVRTQTGRSVRLKMGELPWHYRTGERLAGMLPANPLWSIAAVFLIMSALAVFGNVVRYFQEYLSDKAAILAVNDIRRRLYDHVLHVPLSFFGLKGTSDVTSRLVQDTAALQEGYAAVLGKTIQEPIRAAMAFVLAVALSWRLTLFIVVFGPVMFLLIRKFGKKMRRASRKALQNSSSMLGQIEGTLIGIRVVKGANAERWERRRYTGIMDGLVREMLQMSSIDAMSGPIIESLTLLVGGAILLYAARLVLVTHQLTAGRFIMVMLALMNIAEPLRRISKVNNSLQKANAAAGRIFETLDVPVERPRMLRGAEKNQRRARVKIPPIQREVRFEGVTFTYHGGTSPAVNGVDLVVPKGQSVAVVGRNGSGKTTLLAMLPRFYDPQSGRVTIDGVDVRDATLRSLRGQIGIVTQDSVIFPGTIAQNIAYGEPRPDGERVIEAAKRAFAHEFITEKQQGYDTVLGEMGGQLSGGQRQRLCIARAIYRATPILILDEATSQVDAESEHLIQEAIAKLMKERTTFVIAHRFSTILSANTIVVMERGKIVGQGGHEELLATCPTYEQLYERQLIGAGVG